MNIPHLQKLTEWLIDGARSAVNSPRMMEEICERMVQAGLPLWRVGVFIRTLHPDIFGRNFIWRPDEEVEIGTVDFDILDTPGFINSPLALVFTQGKEVRGRLDELQSGRFPIFADLDAEGVTDYIALPLMFIDGSIHASSWTTKQPGGFSDEQMRALRSLIPPLARVIEIVSLQRTAALLLDTYVGNRAGARAETVVEILNQYFDCQVASIRAHGGEVLKYMGDGLLAVFPIDEYVGDAQQVCSKALEAANESRASVADMAYPIGETVERFRFGVALHVGRILYGNIGGGNRLDFTCIGPAVNLAARLEKMASRLNRTIVASAGFAGICSGGWAELGEFPIAGFSKAERVFGLLDEQPAS